MTKNSIINQLEEGIKERDQNKLSEGLVNFIVSFYTDPSDQKKIESNKIFLRNTYGLNFSEDDPRKMFCYINNGVKDLMCAFKEKKNKTYLFGFFTETSGQRLYFDTVDNAVWYTGGLDNGALERFVQLYGQKVHLNL